jgi:ArsR family transcriptional regulator, arsenate/arsenite/antimonite-responsive transcriptional repressor
MESTVRILKAISDESRLRILNLILSADEICVCDLESTLKFSQTKVSRHLTVLKNAGLVNDRRQGLWILYTYTGGAAEPHRKLLAGLKDVFGSDPVFQEDIQRLKQAVKSGRCKTFNVIHPNRAIKVMQLQGDV